MKTDAGRSESGRTAQPIAAVLLAAGGSRRMGRPKLTLPWGTSGSVIGHVVGRYADGGAHPIVVVTGADRQAVERALRGTNTLPTHNPDHQAGGMLSSIRVGLKVLQAGAAEAALLAPADLPLLTVDTIRAVIHRRRRSGSDLIVPSYQMRRGHPVLVGRPLWRELLDLPHGDSLRQFLRRRAASIDYLVVDDPGVLADLDTPEDYRRAAAPAGE